MTVLDSLRIEKLNAACLLCGNPLKDRHRVTSAYVVSDLRSFETQIELGIIGANVRNFWKHVDCFNHDLGKNYHMQPDINHCIKCNAKLDSKDIVIPVFQVVATGVCNPHDSTDIGISLGERVYLLHADCNNTACARDSRNILYAP